MKEQIAKSVVWIVWSRGVLQVVSFLSTLVVARLLSPVDYGLMALAGICTMPVSSIAELGLGAAMVQFRDLEETELNACFWLTMSVAGLGYLALYIFAPAIANWFASPRLSTVLRIVGLTLPLAAVRVVPDSLLRKRLELNKVSQAEIVSVMVSIPVVVGMAWTGSGVWALVAVALLMPSVQGVVSFWFVRWWPGLRMGGRRFHEVIRYSLATLGARVCWAVYQQADIFVLGKISGDVALGFYSMAKQLATLPVEKVTTAVNQLAYPVMAELQADREAMRISLLRVIRLIAWVTFPLCIGLMVMAKDFVWVALSEKWLRAVPIIQVLCLYAMILSVAVLLPPVLMARYRAKFLFGYNLTLLAVMPLAFWLGALWSGAAGVAVAWVAVYPIIMVRMAREAFSEVGVSRRKLWTELRPPLEATLVMMVAMLLVQSGIASWARDLMVARLAAMSLAGAAVYSAWLFRFGGPVRAEMLEVAGLLFRRTRQLPTAN